MCAFKFSGGLVEWRMSPSRTNGAGFSLVQSMALLTVQDMSDDSGSSFSESEQVGKNSIELQYKKIILTFLSLLFE